MLAARLHGPADLRVERVGRPGLPARGQVLLRVRATGICGSDLHSYLDGRIGDTRVEAPLVLGHEFAGVVEAVGPETVDGEFRALKPGTRVAVDPAQPCGRCERCEQGDPNLCERLQFCGVFPDGGSLCEWMLMPGRSCFPVPQAVDDASAALLEPLGVALHAVDLAQLRVGACVAILGAGPIGLLVLQVAKLAGARPIYVADPLPWRLALAQQLGAHPLAGAGPAVREALQRATAGRGADVVFEAAWGGEAARLAAELARMGGRVVLVGIPSDDELAMRHSTARRKGLTLALCRRMKHVYPRAIRLVQAGQVDVGGLISHRWPLRRAPEAFALNAAYRDQVIKIVIDS